MPRPAASANRSGPRRPNAWRPVADGARGTSRWARHRRPCPPSKRSGSHPDPHGLQWRGSTMRSGRLAPRRVRGGLAVWTTATRESGSSNQRGPQDQVVGAGMNWCFGLRTARDSRCRWMPTARSERPDTSGATSGHRASRSVDRSTSDRLCRRRVDGRQRGRDAPRSRGSHRRQRRPGVGVLGQIGDHLGARGRGVEQPPGPPPAACACEPPVPARAGRSTLWSCRPPFQRSRE